MHCQKYFIIAIVLITSAIDSFAQISAADEDEFNYEHLLIYVNAAVITEGDKRNIDTEIVKEYDFSSKNYRYIYWQRRPQKEMSSYLPWNIEKILKLEYLGERYINGAYTILIHRDCERKLVLTTRFWNDNKTITLSWEWFSAEKSEEAKYLKGCPLIKKRSAPSSTKGAIYRGRKYKRD